MFEQQCPSCKSEWKAIKTVNTCPFCGSEMELQKEDFKDVESVFKYIIGTRGIEIIENKQLFLGLFSDYAPMMQKEKRIIEVAMSAKVYTDLMVVDKSDIQEQNIAFSKAVNKLVEDFCLNDFWAEKVVKWFAEPMGWSSLCGQKSPAPVYEQGGNYNSNNSGTYYEKLFSVGETVAFGEYRYDDAFTTSPIEWTILDIKDGKTLLWAKNCIDAVPYNSKKEKCSWGASALREWLKKDFLSSAFSNDELDSLCKVKFMNQNKNTNETGESVFVLSKDDIEHYKLTKTQLAAKATPYALQKKIFSNGDRFAYYWLRTPGNGDAMQMYVDLDGSIVENGARINLSGVGVRPAVWVDCRLLSGLISK